MYTAMSTSRRLSSCYAQNQYDANLAIRDLLLASTVRPMNYDKSFWFIQCFGDAWSTIQPGNDHLASERLWIGIFSGVAAYRFHRDLPAPEGWPMGLGLNEVAQTHLSSMRMLLDEIDIFSMEPQNDLITGERQEARGLRLAAPGSSTRSTSPDSESDSTAGRTHNRQLWTIESS